MANKMLIDATHPEETRVVVVRGNRVEEFDFESASRRQLRGNIYLAKVTRVEPSLQAAFVEYGGNRHGFLAFSEIHPDYYQIPVADRQALIAEEERAHREAEDEVDRRAGRRRGRGAERRRDTVRSAPVRPEAGPEASDQPEATADLAVSHEAQFTGGDAVSPAAGEETRAPDPADSSADPSTRHEAQFADAAAEDHAEQVRASAEAESPEPVLVVREAVEEQEAAQAADQADHESRLQGAAEARGAGEPAEHAAADNGDHVAREQTNGNGDDENGEEEEVVESVGGDDALEEATERLPRIRRQYKIQEVIKRRQIMLVQVVKEERGTKGAALTTYLSLAGRYSVLMPNTARGGGISRKITSAQDRKRLKDVAQELEVPEGMGVILRTAGASRTKAEIKRDFEYLLRLWEQVRDLTLKSTAPTLVYEEGSLIKRAIRDLYNKDIDEVLVAGDDAYSEAKDFMRTLMPSHAKNVKPYRDTQPIFTRYGVESQLDAMFSPVVQLKSGGYIVLNQAEALVAIDVNSGRATREHHIEDTALKTNVEAADEVARQLRLRDLAGLIVIYFIDMDEKRNNRAVERRLKESLKHDRARIQVGRISHFGLMEMSRQRIRSSVLESSTEKCPHCGGMGHVRSVGSVALQLLRSLEEMLIKGATHNLTVRTRADVALYVLNHKRAHLRELETRFRITIAVNADPAIVGQQPFVIERGEQVHSVEAAKAIAAQLPSVPIEIEEEDDEEETVEEDPAEVRIGAEPEPERKHRRRRRRRRGGEERQPAEFVHDTDAEHTVVDAEDHESEAAQGEEADETEPADQREAGLESREDAERRRRRRGRRGGRRNRREREESGPFADSGSMEPEVSSAVADFDRPWMPSEPAAKESGEPPQMEPAAGGESTPTYRAPVTTALVPPPEQPEQPMSSERPMAPAEEPPRRRSTVREPAPFVIGSGEAPVAPPPPPSAPPQPSAEPPEEAEQPRRTGWWSRRLMGGSKG
ncbi:MAG: Rne/Rng family ribonuclease [Xanthobacteraceae bacterium]